MKKVKRFITALILIYLCITVALFLLQRSMIYYPDTSTPDIAPYALNGFGGVTVTTADNLTLNAWYRRADLNKPTLVFFHGNAGHYGHRIFDVAEYVAQGYGVLLAGYRGYGGNMGKPSEAGFYADARAYLTFLIQNKVREGDIILYGQSIGTGVATQMATEFKDVKALVLEAPYTRLPDVAKRTYFFLPVELLMKDKFENINKIADVTAPVLIIHGEQDTIIPFKMGVTLFEAAQSKKQLVALKNNGHNDMPYKVRAEKVLEFITNL